MGKRAFKYDKILVRKFGEKIFSLRKNNNFTQDELAFKANISPSYLSAIERGVTDTTISTAKRLAKALNIRMREPSKRTQLVTKSKISTSGGQQCSLTICDEQLASATVDLYELFNL